MIIALVWVLGVAAVVVALYGAFEKEPDVVLCGLVTLAALLLGTAAGYYNVASAEDYDLIAEIAKALNG